MKERFAYVFRLALTLTLIAALTAGALAGVNALTADRIDAIRQKKTLAAIAQVLPNGEKAREISPVPEGCPAVTAVYGADSGWAIETVVPGFGGSLTMMVGISPAGSVLGISIVNHSETAGLGAEAAADNARGRAFRKQFEGQAGPFSVTKDGGTIDAVSGATVTSRAVAAGVNAALDCAGKLGG